MQKLKKLSVRLHGGIEVGTLEETSAGKMRFKYAKDPKLQLSLSLPIRIKPKVVFEELERQMEILPKALIESIQEVDEKFGYRCEIGPKIVEYVNKNI